MVCHRWTIVLILICIPLLVTVISAFRVRLPGVSPDVKPELKKHKCENCDVNEPNLDQVVNSYRPEIVKRSNEDVKKPLHSDLKSKVISAHKIVTVDTNHDISHPKNNEESRHDKSVTSKKSMFVFDFDDDDSDEIDDEINEPSSIPKFKSSHERISKKNIDNDDDNEDEDEDDDEADVENDNEDENDDDDDDSVDDDDNDDVNDDDDDDDDDVEEREVDDDNDENEDDDDGDEDSYEKMIKLIKKRTSEAVKSRSSEEVGSLSEKAKDDRIGNLKLMLYTTKSNEPEKSQSKEKFPKNPNKSKSTEAIPKIKPQKELPKKQKIVTEQKTVKSDTTEKVKIKPTVDKKVIEKHKPVTETIKDTLSEKKKIDRSVDHKQVEKLKPVKIDSANEVPEKIKQVKKDDDKLDLDKVKPIKKDDDTLVLDKIKPVKKEDNKLLFDKVKAVKIGDDKLVPDKAKPIKSIGEKSSKENIEKTKDKKPVVESVKPKDVLKETKMELKEKHATITKTSSEKTKMFETKQKDSEESVKNIEKLIKKQESRQKDFDDDKTENEKKKESDIQFMTESLRRRNLLQSEFEDMYSFLPTFAPNFSRIHNPECRRHGQILLRQLRGTKLWALNMLDATAKIPSGVLQGNGIQLGDFDQCLGIRARVQLDSGSVVKLQGKYCLAMLDLKANLPEMEMPVYLAQGKNLFKSRLDDPGHFVPRFSTLSWGICVPAPCEPEDVEVMLKDAIKHYQKKIGVTVRIKVEEHDCHMRQGGDWWEDWLEIPTILTLSYYLFIVLLVLIATVQDYLARQNTENENEDGDENKETGGFLQSFSLYNTISKLIAPASEKEIACIHGLRAVATVALLVAHKFLPVAVTPYNNRLKISETVSSPLLSWCRAGWIFTDCFLLLSGTLTSYRTSKEDSVVTKLLSKYLRLTPALLAVVLFYAYVWDNISVGPMWGTLVTRNAEICQDSWWWNILYVQNYMGFENMCAPQTHQLALDLQLTIIGGVIVWAIHSEILLARAIMPVIHLLSAYSRYTTYKEHRLTALAYQGVSVSQLYRTGNLSYTSTYHRCTPYLIGVSLGLMLRKPARIGKFLRILGWLVYVTLWGLVLWAGADSGDLQYRYDVTFAAQYAAFAPIAVGLAFAWLIYAVHNSYFGALASFLSSRPLLFISRISYALYLTQFIIFLTNSAIQKTSKEFTIISLFDIHEISTILSVSIVLTLFFVIPLQSLPRISFTSKTANVTKEDTDPSNEAEETEESKPETNNVIKEDREIKSHSFMAHREVLEEIPEAEVEYEVQRDSNEGLEEIAEEEEEEMDEEMIEHDEEMMEHIEDEELEVIEEEQGGEDEWVERDENISIYSRNNQDLEEWEWTGRSDGTGAQKYRYSR